MGNIRLLETDTIYNSNLVGATGTASYTSNGGRAVFCDVSLYGVAGNGDYVMYITRQISGSSSANVILPKTTMTAASGETNIGGQSGLVSLGNGDIVLVYIDGLAGDTSVTGTTVRWWELYALAPLTADRQLNVAADGDIGGNVDGTVNAVVGGYVTVTGTVTISDASVDAVWDEVLTGATHNVASSSGKRLRTVAGSQIDSGTAVAGAADSITLATSASTTAGIYVGCLVVIDGGTGVGQSRYIVGYTAGRVASVARHWTTTPDGTSTYVLYADNQVHFIHMGLAVAGGANTITLASSASSTNDIYNGQSIRILSGLGDDQIRLITDYDGLSKVATVTPAWTVQPDSTSYYGTLQYGPAQTAAIVAGVVDAAAIATNAIDADALAADAVTEITDDIFAEVIEGTTTFRTWVQRIGAVLFGKASGGGVAGSKKFRDTTDAVNRVDATTDVSGNRTAVSFDDTDT